MPYTLSPYSYTVKLARPRLRLRLLLALCLWMGVACFGESLLAQSSSARRQAARREAARVDSIRLDSLRLDSLRIVGLRRDSIRRDSTRRDSAIAARIRAEIEREESDEPQTIEELVPSALVIRGSDSLRRSGIPVTFKGDTLFRVYRKVGAFSPEQRARMVSNSIRELATVSRAQMDSLLVEEDESGRYNVIYQDRVINSVSPEDASILDTTALAVATRNRDIIVAALIRDYEDRTLLSTLRDIGIFVALTALLVLLWIGIKRVFHFLQLSLQKRLKVFMSRQLVGGQSQLMRVVNPRAQMNVLLALIKALRILTLLFLLYLYLPFLFSQLSYTRGFGERLLEYVLTPLAFVRDSIVGFVPSLIFIAIIVWLSAQLVKFIGWVAGRIQSGELSIDGFYADWAKPTANLVRTLVIVLTFVVIWPLLPGSDSDVFKGVSVFIGLLLSLGGASTVGNAVSGVILTYMRPFQIGHRVKIGDTVGDVVSKTLLVTRIRTTKNEEITVPNGNLLSGGIINYTSLADTVGLVLHTSITIGYDVPWPQVHALMLAAAAKTPDIEATPEPFVLQKSLQDWYVEYELNAYTRNSHGMPRTYSNLHANIQDAFRDADVEIMSSHYMHVRTGNETTIPKKE